MILKTYKRTKTNNKKEIKIEYFEANKIETTNDFILVYQKDGQKEVIAIKHDIDIDETSGKEINGEMNFEVIQYEIYAAFIMNDKGQTIEKII
jgi:hypothetical protein